MKFKYLTIKIRMARAVIALILIVCVTFTTIVGMRVLAQPDFYETVESVDGAKKEFIKWVNFDVSYTVLKQALKYDIDSQSEQVQLKWVELLAIAACKSGGNFSEKRNDTIDKTVKRIRNGETVAEITKDMKYYSYYYEAYSAVLNGFVGSYKIEAYDENAANQVTIKETYGLKVFSPIAKGFGYSHSSDFGVSRSYGYQRKHLGNDLIGGIGTPIVAVEDGTIENMGWNKYGGWRMGIRSFDNKRYYYYAHLRKGHPYAQGLKEGMEVKAGDVIGFLGMTGYSYNEDHNGMSTPHLHFGMQLVFDESQKEGYGEIWVDVYNIIKLLQNVRSKVVKNETTGEYERVYHFISD